MNSTTDSSLDNTLITSLDGIKPRAFSDPDASTRFINKVAVMIFGYIVVVLYPAYGLLRSFWVPDFPIIDLEGSITALIVGALFAWFARRSIANRVIGQVESGQD